MVVAERISSEIYEKLALGNPMTKWELHRGQLREKPLMSVTHGQVPVYLTTHLSRQLNPKEFRISVNHGRLRVPQGNYYIPDLIVMPFRLVEPRLGRFDELEVYVDPLPLVVEVWSESTADFDVMQKLPDYRERGDWEIWLLDPYRRQLTSWRRRPNGTNEELDLSGGVISLHALPTVSIDLDELFDWS